MACIVPDRAAGARYERILMYRMVAQDMALTEAAKRKDCDMAPRVVSVRCEAGFVLIDVQYSSEGPRGRCALYEYRTRDGVLTLAAD